MQSTATIIIQEFYKSIICNRKSYYKNIEKVTLNYYA